MWLTFLKVKTLINCDAIDIHSYPVESIYAPKFSPSRAEACKIKLILWYVKIYDHLWSKSNWTLRKMGREMKFDVIIIFSLLLQLCSTNPLHVWCQWISKLLPSYISLQQTLRPLTLILCIILTKVSFSRKLVSNVQSILFSEPCT